MAALATVLPILLKLSPARVNNYALAKTGGQGASVISQLLIKVTALVGFLKTRDVDSEWYTPTMVFIGLSIGLNALLAILLIILAKKLKEDNTLNAVTNILFLSITIIDAILTAVGVKGFTEQKK